MNRRSFLGAGLRGALFGAALATGLARVELPKAKAPEFKPEDWTFKQESGYYVSPELVKEFALLRLTPAG